MQTDTISNIPEEVVVSSLVRHPSGVLLYRTLLHEIGHFLDEAQCADAWGNKPRREKEDFAHRYATEQAQKLRLQSLIRFAPIIDHDAMGRGGVDQSWFNAYG